MKATLLVLATAGCSMILSSCTEITFTEPQPKGVSALLQMPPPIRGKYIPVFAPGEGKMIPEIPGSWHEDMIIVEPWGYRFEGSDEDSWMDRATLSDSLVIKYYEEYYFVNFRIDSIHWSLRLLKPTAEGSLDFYAVDLGSEEKETELIPRLAKIIGVKKETEGYDTYYEINPTRDQLMSIISMGFFTRNGLVQVKKR